MEVSGLDKPPWFEYSRTVLGLTTDRLSRTWNDLVPW